MNVHINFPCPKYINFQFAQYLTKKKCILKFLRKVKIVQLNKISAGFELMSCRLIFYDLNYFVIHK